MYIHNLFDLRVDMEGWWWFEGCSCGFACQPNVSKMFACPVYLHSKNGVVNLHIYIYIYILYYIYILVLNL